MSISVIKVGKRSRSAGKTALVYLVVAVFCVIFDRVYALYGHGVYSAAMSLMFLYPLAGGTAVFALLWGLVPDAERIRRRTLFYNSYNSGIAALTVASALRGVFDIAGTSSPYLPVMIVSGALFCAFGLAGYCLQLRRRGEMSSRPR